MARKPASNLAIHRRLRLHVLRQIAVPAQHPISLDDGVVHHALASAHFDPSARTGGAVAAFGGGADSGKVSVVAVGVAEEEGVAHRTTVAPVDLEVDKRLARHGHERDSPVDENGPTGS